MARRRVAFASVASTPTRRPLASGGLISRRRDPQLDFTSFLHHAHPSCWIWKWSEVFPSLACRSQVGHRSESLKKRRIFLSLYTIRKSTHSRVETDSPKQAKETRRIPPLYSLHLHFDSRLKIPARTPPHLFYQILETRPNLTMPTPTPTSTLPLFPLLTSSFLAGPPSLPPPST